MGIINILDAQTSNLIAAGEVVERHSSAAKEMLENSIDASATAITLEIKNGGRSLVRVTDNGCGFLRDDIPKALLRHATSKISCGDDINGITSLGFRGEALAAIGSVSRLDIITKHRSEEMGTRLTSDENGIVMVDTGCPDGTTVAMRDIFYNTPARQKFLKKDGTEGASCIAAAEKLALSHPEISFTVISDGERRFTTAGDGKLYPAIYAIYGREFAKSLIQIEYELSGVRVEGYITTPDKVRGSRNMQIMYVNGRYVKSKTVQAALEEAFRSFIPRGKFPGCVIFVTLDPQLTDVNVHPAKTEIKFASEKDVFHCVYYSVKNALCDTPDEGLLVSNDQQKLSAEAAPIDDSKAVSPDYRSEDLGLGAQKVFLNLDVKAEEVPVKKETPEKTADIKATDIKTADVKEEKTVTTSYNSRPSFRADIGEEDVTGSESSFVVRDPFAKESFAEEEGRGEYAQTVMVEQKPVWRMIGQAYDSYIFVETEENVLVIDKHAAHERIIYEGLAANKELHVQELLTGIPVSMDREQATLLLENKAYLEEKGFAVEDFGEGTLLVRTVPVTLSNIKGLSGILEDFASALADGNQLSFKERCDRALYTVACKAALKAGVKNRPEDDENVVRMLAENPSLRYCPHGRPFIKKLPKREIEKYFDR